MPEPTINFDALQNIDLGDAKELSPEQIKKIMDQTGNQIWRSAPKPIVVIYLPEYFSMDGRRGGEYPLELMKALNGNFGNGEQDGRIYSDYWKDYYWLCFTKYDIDAPEFKVFHPKDFTDIQFQELKDMVLADLEAMKTKPE